MLKTISRLFARSIYLSIYLSAGGVKSGLSCGIGYYIDNGNCIKCPDGYTSDSDNNISINKCYTQKDQECRFTIGENGKDINATGYQECYFYYGHDDEPVNCWSCKFKKCDRGYFFVNYVEYCDECPEDYFCEKNRKRRCPNGGKSNKLSSSVKDCYTNDFTNKKGKGIYKTDRCYYNN